MLDTVYQRLKFVRNHFDLSRKEMGEILGMTGSNVGALEDGIIKNVQDDTINKVSEKFKVDRDWLKHGFGSLDDAFMLNGNQQKQQKPADGSDPRYVSYLEQELEEMKKEVQEVKREKDEWRDQAKEAQEMIKILITQHSKGGKYKVDEHSREPVLLN